MADVFTQAGEEKIADLVTAQTWYGAWGTGTGGAVKGDTALGTESAESRVVTTDTQPSADVNRFVFTITSASSQTISEAGVFDAATVGNLLLRSNFTGIPVVNTESIEFTFDLTWS